VGLAPLGAREILGERGGSHAGKFIWGPKVGKMQHGLNVSERYVRGGNLASVRRSELGKVRFGSFGYKYFVFADLGRVVPTPPRGSAPPPPPVEEFGGGFTPGRADTAEGECRPLGGGGSGGEGRRV